MPTASPWSFSDGRNRVPHSRTELRHKPIIVRRGGGFTGLIGYVGRTRIEGISTRSWLERFAKLHPNEPLPDFCPTLAEALTRRWQRQRLKSGLWIFVSGIEGREVRFWFITNIKDLDVRTGTYFNLQQTFDAVNDLDVNYIQPQLAPGQTKAQLLETRMYFFRNGVLMPSAFIFDAFGGIMQTIYAQQISGFPPIRSLDDLAFFARQRLAFTMRLYSPKHGIAKASPAGIDGAGYPLRSPDSPRALIMRPIHW